MKKPEIMNNLTRSFSKANLKLKKHSPEILIVAGIIGTVASTVMACKATLKVNDILDESKETIDKIHECMNDEELVNTGRYTKEDSKKDLAVVYAKTGVNLAKLYGPAIIVGTLSLTAIVKSHNILRTRNVALAAAYATVDKGFKEYRGRVVERFGKELDRELRYDIKAKEIEERVVDENGNEKIEKKVVNTFDPTKYSGYAIAFDDGNFGWDKDPEKTKFFLVQQQNWANEKLQKQGYLFLNDVYTMLGANKTAAGQVVGWVYDEKNPIGDNYVDFGIFDIYNEKARDFINGKERVIILDFNVDGNILDYI